VCSEWAAAREEVTRERAAFRRAHASRRRGRMQIEYPPELAAVLEYSEWLQTRIRGEIAEGRPVDDMAAVLAFPPESHILTFRSCTAFGYHYRAAESDTAEGFKTYDSGIALTCTQACRSSRADGNIVEATLSYVGVLREILQLMYQQTPVILFRGSWVPPNEHGNATIKRDKYGFWMANFRRRQRVNQEPYVFPAQVKQVFFADDPVEEGWKVVLQSNCRSTRFMDPTSDGLLGADAGNVNLDAIRNVWGNAMNISEGQAQAELVQNGAQGVAQNRRAMRTKSAWEGRWSSGESDSASDHDCDAEF
jgi:hypothetical protein